MIDAKEIVRRIDGQIGMLQREARISRFAGGANLVLEWMIPARDYILAAASQIAEKDAVLYAYESEVLAAGFGTIAEMVAQIAEMRKVTGWPCPTCGHWLKVGHSEWTKGGQNSCHRFMCRSCRCQITAADLIASHPLIAAEMGLVAKEGS